MRRLFFSNIALLVVLNLIIKPFYLFGIDAQVQNTVGPEAYGIYFSLLNLSFFFNILLDFGITNYNTKNVAQYPVTVKKYLGDILGVKLSLGVIYFFVSIVLALVLGYDKLELKWLLLLLLNQFFVSVTLYFRSNFAGLHLFKLDAIFSVLDRFLLIGICSVLLYVPYFKADFNIEWFIYAQTITYGLTVLTALFTTLYKIGIKRLRVVKVMSLSILRKSTPYAMLVLLMMLYTRMDAVMLERLLPDGKVQTGIYAQGFRLLDAFNIFGLLVAGLLLPIFSRLIKQNKSFREVLNAAVLLLAGVSTFVSIVCAFYANEIMGMIYVYNSKEAAQVFPFIILSFIPISMTYAFGTLLTAAGKLKALNILAFFGIALNLMLNLWLIPLYEAKGAAVATVFTQFFAAFGQAFIVLFIFKRKPNYSLIFRLIGFVLVLLLTLYFFTKVDLLIWYELIMVAAIGTSALFFLKIIEIKQVKSLFSGIKSK